MYEGVRNRNMMLNIMVKEDPPIYNNGFANVIYRKG
jgi:hypothetical protein